VLAGKRASGVIDDKNFEVSEEPSINISFIMIQYLMKGVLPGN